MAIKKATITVDDFMKSVGITKKEATDAEYGVKTKTVSSKAVSSKAEQGDMPWWKDLLLSGIGDAESAFGSYNPTPQERSRVGNTLNAAGKSTTASNLNALGFLLGEDESGQDAAWDAFGADSIYNASKGTWETPKKPEDYELKSVKRAKEKAQNWAYQKANEFNEEAAESEKLAKDGLGKAGQTLVDIGIAGAQLAGDAALNAALPGAGLAAMGVRSFGSATEKARNEGADMQQQFNYGVTVAAAEVLSEKLFDAAKLFGGGGADDVVERIVNKLAKTDAGRTATRILLSGVGEGAEEAVTDLVEPAIRGAFYDKDAMLASYGSPEGRRELAAQAAYDALIGGVLGVAGGGVGILNGENAQKNSALRTQEQLRQAGYTGTVRQKTKADLEREARQADLFAGNLYRLGDPTRQLTAAPVEAAQSVPETQEKPQENSTLRMVEEATGMREAAQNPTQERTTDAGQIEERYANRQPQEYAPEDHIDNRTDEYLAKRSVKSFQYNHPELHEYYEAVARDVLEMVDGSLSTDQYRRGMGTVTHNTPALQSVLEETGLTRAELGRALEAIVNDHGAENYAAAKRTEKALDSLLVNGYYTRGSNHVPPNQAYLNAKGGIVGGTDANSWEYYRDNNLSLALGEITEEEAYNDWRAQRDAREAAKAAQEQSQNSDNFADMQQRAAETAAGQRGTLPEGQGAASRGFDPYSNWQNQSDSFHNVGEKADRVVDLPTENLQGQRTMKGGQTVMESANTPLFRASQIADLYLDGRLSFDPKTNQELVDEARGVIEKDGWRKALTDWTADVRAGKVSDKLTAMGATLLNNAGNAFDVSTKEYMDIVCDYVQLTSNAGHALQANRILKTLTPESRLYAMQRSIYSIAEEAGIEDAQINPELAEKYRNAKNDTERDAVVSEIQQDIAKRMGSTLLDKFNALRYVNMLGNFKTQIRNVTGNATMAIMQKVKNEIAAGIETIAHTVSGGKVERTKSFGVAPELYAAAWNDFRSVQKAALGEGKYSDINEISNNEFLRGIDGKRTIFKNNGTWGTEKSDRAFLRSAFMQKVRKGTDALWKAPEAYRKLTNWAMEQGDVIFSRTTYADALAGYLKAHGMNDAEALRNGTVDPVLLDDARMYAIQEAQEATFRDSNPFSDWVSKAGRRSGTPKAVRVMAEGIMPFRKTPANVLVRAEEYSPIGAVNSLIKTVQAISKNSDVNANDAINSWAKTLTGSTVFAVGCLLAKAGLLHGADDDDDKQAAFDSLTGHQEYALELPGGTSITLDTFAPTVMPLLMGGALYDISAENGWNLKNIESVATSLADPMINMSMLSGVNDSLNNLKFTDNNLGQLAITSALNYLTQGLTNTLAGQAERTFEPNRMTTYVEKDSGTPEWMQRLLGKASAKTPGWDYHQTEYLDAWGRTQSNGSLVERAFNNFLNPTYTSKISDDKVDVELQRLADSTATTKMFPNGTAPYELEFDDKAKNISQQQRETYQKTYGQTAYSNVKSLINSAQYGKMSDGERAAAINYLYQYATTQAKKKVGADGGETPGWTSKSEGNIAENAAYRAFLDTARAKATPMYPSTSTETNGAQMQGTLKLNLSDAYKLNVFAQFLGEGAQEHVHEAYSKGYSLQQITDFYQAMNLKDESGKAVYKKDDLIRWATQNGFTYGQAQTMYRIFHPSKKNG